MAERVRRPHPFRTETPHPAVVREFVVTEVLQPAERYVRVTLGGAQVGAFTDDVGNHPPVAGDGFDDVAVLFFPDATGTIVRPRVIDGHLLPDEAGAVIAREYTVRENVAEGIVIDLVLHESGPASDWARHAAVGDRLVGVAPRLSRGLPISDRFIAIGDATALPALSRLQTLAPHSELLLGLDPDLHPLAPAGAHLIADGDVEAVQAWLAERIAENATYWIAGESSFVTTVRRLLVTDFGIAKERVQFTGYWRRGASGLLDHQPE